MLWQLLTLLFWASVLALILLLLLRVNRSHVLLLFGASALALLIFGWGAYAWQLRPSANWRQVAAPAERPVELLSANEYNELYFESARNLTYVCLQDEPCREIPTEEIRVSQDVCDPGRRFDVAPPPEAPVDTMEVHLCGADVILQLNYAILPDGTIWELYNGWSWSTPFASVFVALLGSVLTFTIGAAWILWHNIRKRRRYNAP